jgi:hypothetical protein
MPNKVGCEEEHETVMKKDIRDDGLNDDEIKGADHDGCMVGLCPQHLI